MKINDVVLFSPIRLIKSLWLVEEIRDIPMRSNNFKFFFFFKSLNIDLIHFQKNNKGHHLPVRENKGKLVKI